MSFRVFAGGLVLASAMIVGCDNNSDDTPETAPYTAPAGSAEAQALESARQVTGQAQQRAADAEQSAVNAAEASPEQAQKLIDQATQYIRDNKWDLAEQTLDQLDKIKASLPESMQEQIASARQLLQTRRTAGNAGDAVGNLLGNQNK